MNIQNPSAEIDLLRSEILKLRAEIEALKFSESVKRTNAADFEAKYKALVTENNKVLLELQTIKAINASLAPMQEQNGIRLLATQMFSLSFQVLKLSQEILEKIFPDDQTVHATLFGPTLRKMFEFVSSHLLPSNFFDSSDSIDIKIHSGIDQFMEFAVALTKFIYDGKMGLPGCDFIVCGMVKPRKVQRVISNDRTRLYEFVKFVISFYSRDTKKIYRIVFSCDAGHSFPQEDFDVNSLSFDAIRGFDAWLQGSQFPVLQIIMGIMNQRAQWYPLPDAHFSEFARVLALNGYFRHGCLFVTSTGFCPFSQDKAKYALEFSGCRCGIDRCISLGMVCGFLKSNPPNSPLRCPFCKENLPNLTHELDCPQIVFDLSSIEDENVLKQDELKALQEDGRSQLRIFGLVKSPESEIDQIQKDLDDLAKVKRRWSRLPNLPKLPKDVEALFFRVNPDEESDPEPETESEDYDDEENYYQDDEEDDDQNDDHDDDQYDEYQFDYYPRPREPQLDPQFQQVQPVQQVLDYDQDYEDPDPNSYYSSGSSYNESDNASNAEDEVEHADPDAYQESQGNQFHSNYRQNPSHDSDGYASD